MIKVYGRRSSSNVQKVHWVLDELGRPFEIEETGGRFGGLDDPAYRALNPHGLVPTLVEDGAALWESHAIVRYLARRFPEPPLLPEDPLTLAQCEAWMDWQPSVLWPRLFPAFFQLLRTPEAERSQAAIDRSVAEAAGALGPVESLLGHQPYLLGQRFTLADVPLGIVVHRWFTLDLDRPELPAIANYFERLKERPAYRNRVLPITLE